MLRTNVHSSLEYVDNKRNSDHLSLHLIEAEVAQGLKVVRIAVGQGARPFGKMGANRPGDALGYTLLEHWRGPGGDRTDQAQK